MNDAAPTICQNIKRLGQCSAITPEVMLAHGVTGVWRKLLAQQVVVQHQDHLQNSAAALFQDQIQRAPFKCTRLV
jgi:hypothetical protein